MKQREFIQRTGMILGTLPALGAASLPASYRTKISTTFGLMDDEDKNTL